MNLPPRCARGWRCALSFSEPNRRDPTLAGALAAELGTSWVPECGREASIVREGGLSAPWRTDEFDLIVDRQIAREDAALRTAPTPVLICDTDVLATALWHERYVGTRAERIFARAGEHAPALYILTGDDIPFVQDGMRDGEHSRHDMQQRFRDVLSAQSVPWIEVHGTLDRRVRVEVLGVDDLPVPDGEIGELVVTAGENPLLPLVRYRTGDFGRLVQLADGGVAIADLEGREHTRFLAADGRIVPSVDLTQQLQAGGALGWSIEQLSDGRVDARIAGGDGDAVRDALSALLGQQVTLERVASLAELGEGKPRRYRSALTTGTE